MHLAEAEAGRVRRTLDAMSCGSTRVARSFAIGIDVEMSAPFSKHARTCDRCGADERRARLVATGLARMAGEWEQPSPKLVTIVMDRVGAVDRLASFDEPGRGNGEWTSRVVMAGAGAMAAAGLAAVARRRLGAIS